MRADSIAALRALRASAAFTAVALVVLALGIGASTAVFSMVDAVVLRGLPFDEHDRLVAVGTRRPPPVGDDPARDPQQLFTTSPQDFMDWDQRQQVFASLAATTTSFVTLREAGGEPEDLRALRATADTFEVLRNRPGPGPAVHRRERGGGAPPRGGAERRALAAALRLGPSIVGPNDRAGRRGRRGVGRDAPGRHLPGGRGAIPPTSTSRSWCQPASASADPTTRTSTCR